MSSSWQVLAFILRTKPFKYMYSYISKLPIPVQVVWAVAPPVENPVAHASHALPETQEVKNVSAAQAVHVVPSPV